MKLAVLHLLANPDAAVLILFAGILLVYLECNRPGSILPGCLGALLILLAIDSLARMPLRPAALASLAAGIALLLAEICFKARNLLAVVATLAIVAGLAMLLQPFAPARVHMASAVFAGSVFSVTTLSLGKIALRARRNKRTLSPSGLASNPRSARRRRTG